MDLVVIVGSLMSNSETKNISAEVSAELLEQIDRYAELVQRPRDWVINQALASWLSTEREKYEATLEAMAEVDAGLSVSNEEVRAWIESWDTDHPFPMPTPR
jgi:predicted transcriptional regulator